MIGVETGSMRMVIQCDICDNKFDEELPDAKEEWNMSMVYTYLLGKGWKVDGRKIIGCPQCMSYASQPSVNDKINTDKELVDVIDSILYRLKSTAPMSKLRKDFKDSLYRWVGSHELNGGQHDFAALPKGHKDEVII